MEPEQKSSARQGETNVYIESLGAAGTVTGSKHLLRTPDLDVLVDCGLFQGAKALREKNWEPLPVKASAIGAMVITHAHLDHCGYIPLLVKQGYHGKIYMSPPTRDLTELILRDSAKIQEEDAQKANRHGYSKHSPALPLYTVADVEACLRYFVPVEANQVQRLSQNIEFQFSVAGHIPGACSILFNCFGKQIVFSGDIGRYHSELLPKPVHAPSADFVVMESTYGDRLHEKEGPSAKLAFIINETIAKNGNILIPCFAVGRAQEIIHILYKLKKERRIPSGIPIFLDSPMAASANKALLNYPEWISIGEKEVSQMFRGVTINEDYHGTERILRQKGSKVILAASGMLTGGRVLEYLKHYISDSRNTILLVGYQAEGTRGRALLNHTHEIKIHGGYYPANANVEEIGGLSAHADQAGLITWLKEFSTPPGQVFLVHGEPCAQEALRIKIKDELHLKATLLKQDQKVFLFNTKDNLETMPG
jgi:metallo-beta-lactamase family protein